MYPQAADKYLSNIVLSPFGEGTLKPPPIKKLKVTAIHCDKQLATPVAVYWKLLYPLILIY